MEVVKRKISENVEAKLKECARAADNISAETLHEMGLREIKLRSYQLDGVRWLINSYKAEVGCILADEMGLGKTCQTISFLVYVANLFKSKHKNKNMSLILAPLSVLSNWENELKMFAPKLRFVKYIGSKEERAEIQSIIRQQYEDIDLVLTSYELCLKDEEFVSDFSWNVLVVDEAHRLKNRQSSLHQSLIKYDITHRVLLTGTPLQNNLTELYALLCFIAKNIFREKYINYFLEYFSDVTDESSGRSEELADMLQSFMLRRVKADVLKDLPKKSELILYHGLSVLQKNYYKAVLNKDISAFDVDGKPNRTRLSNVLMQLRKCVAHPYLFDGVEPEPFELGEHLIETSGKLIVVDRLLSHLKQTGHKVLMFSQMTRLLDIVQDYLGYRGYTYERLDGSVRAEERYLAVNKFNTDDGTFVFLLSTKAGGVGLNLTAADTILFLDSDFNPQNDLQAAARAHRIGQLRNVKVIRLVGRSTVEEIILRRAEDKLKLSSAVITSAHSSNQTNEQIKLEDIIKFGLDKLFENDDSTVEDIDFSAVLGTSVDGKWVDSNEAKVTTIKEPADRGIESVNEATQSMYMFEGTDYSRDQEESDDKILQQLIDAHKAKVVDAADAGRSLREKQQGVRIKPGEGFYELPTNSKPRKKLTPEELEQRRIKRAEAAALKEKQKEEQEVKRAQALKKKREDLWKAHNYTSCNIELPESDDESASGESDDDNIDDIPRGDDDDGERELRENADESSKKSNTIQYVIGDVTHPGYAGNNDAILIHCVDNSGRWGKGGLFTSISSRSRQPEEQYQLAGKLKDLALGDLHIIPVDDIQSRQTGRDYVGLIVAQSRDYSNNLSGVKLTALQTAFEKLCYIAKQKKASVHLPRLGYNTPGFNWYGTERLIQKYLASRGVPTFVYYFSRNPSGKRKHNSNQQGSAAKVRPETSNVTKNNIISDDEDDNDDACLSDIFHDVIVHFIDVTGENLKKTTRYIIAYDGDVQSAMKAEVTHVVVDETSNVSEETLKDIKNKNPKVKTVRLSWILDSVRHMKREDESKHSV